MKILLKFVFFLILLSDFIDADTILNNRQNAIYDAKDKSAKVQADIVKDSWINPLNFDLTYMKSKESSTLKDMQTKQATINLNQDIFRSGAIYDTIKQGELYKKLNVTIVSQDKKEQISNIYANTINLRKIDLQIEKSKYLIKSQELTINKKKTLYENGLIDISDLDESIIELSRLNNGIYDLKIQKLEIKKEFKYMSDKSYKSIDLSVLTLYNFDEFLKQNTQIKIKTLDKKIAVLDKNIKVAEYLPKISLFGSYGYNKVDADSNNNYYQYGVKLTIPLDYNSLKQKEKSKLKAYISQLEVKESKIYEKSFYNYALKKLKNIDMKIENIYNTIQRYENLYEMVQALYGGALRTIDDVNIMQNRLESSRLDLLIFELDKKIILNELYKRVELN